MKQTLIVEEVRVKENLRMTSKKPKRGVLVHFIFVCHPPLTSQAGNAGQHRCTGGHSHHGPHGPHHRHSQGGEASSSQISAVQISKLSEISSLIKYKRIHL